MNLNDLNLALCDYELEMDAFAAFRTRQLQANRSSFMDLSSCNELKKDFDPQNEEDRPNRQSFLDDLHVVRELLLNTLEFLLCVFMLY